MSVRQGHAQHLRARARTEVTDLHRPVLRELHGDTLGSDHGLEEELVAVRINPIRQQVVLHLSVRTDLDDRALNLARPLVLRPRVNRHAHGRGGAREAVRGLVREGRRPARQVLGNLRDLQGATAPRAHDRPELRVRHGARGQHIAVVIRVVIEDRQQRRTTRADAEVVVHGLWRRVLVVVFRLRDLLALIRGRSVLFFLLLGGNLIPVVDEDHVLVRQPQRARRDIVEDDARAVRAEDGGGGLGKRRNSLHLVARLVRTRAHERARAGPRAVGAAVVEDGGSRVALRTRVGGGLTLDGLAVEGDGHELRIGREQHRCGLVARVLQDRAGHVFLDEVAEFPTGQDEGITGLVVDDGLIADRRDRQGAGGLEILDSGRLRAPRLAFLDDGDQRRGTGRVGKHRARARHRDDAVAQVLGDRVFGCERNGGGFARVTDPQEAGGRVEDRENGAALHLGGALGQGHSLAD